MNLIRVLRWTISITIASFLAQQILAYIGIGTESSPGYIIPLSTSSFALALFLIPFFIPLITCLIAPSPKKLAGIASVATTILFLIYKASDGLLVYIAIGIGLGFGFLFSYIIFRKTGWNYLPLTKIQNATNQTSY